LAAVRLLFDSLMMRGVVEYNPAARAKPPRLVRESSHTPVQIYESEEVFMDILASFVSKALKEDDAAVIIATPAHRQELNERLMESGHDLAALRLQDRLISLDAGAR
jgi:hypothetical protein